MPFNGSGTFSIINTFVPNSTILSAAVNQNYTDIASGLSNVLTRDGQAGMTAPLGLTSGTASTPSLTFNSDAKSGIYSPGTGIVGIVANALGIQFNSEIYEAASATIAAGGSGYVVGDTIYVTGGTAAVVAAFTVSTVSTGVVTAVTATMPGLYLAKPSNPVSQGSTSGAGTGCTLTITWNDPTMGGYKLGLLALDNNLIWRRGGASSFVSGLMGLANGYDYAIAIGSANLVKAISGSFTFTPQGYLTPTSNTPIITGDVTAATSLYYTPYVGNMIPIYNGTILTQRTFSQMQCTLTSGAQATLNIYDVYCFDNSGTLTLGFSPTWTAGTSGSVTAGSCARGTGTGGTALTRIGGIWTNAVSMTVNNSSSTFTVPANQGTYLGSVYINATAGQLNLYRAWGASRAWDIWNAYNRSPLYLKAGDSTASWSYTTNTIRASNGASTNSLIVFQGLIEEPYSFEFDQEINNNSTTNTQIGIGFNSITTFTGRVGNFNTAPISSINPYTIPVTSKYKTGPSLGINVISCLENCPSNTNGNTFFGTEANMVLSATWRG